MEVRNGPVRRRPSRTPQPHRPPPPAITEAGPRRQRLSRHRHPGLHPLRPGCREASPESLNPRPVVSLQKTWTAARQPAEKPTNARDTVEERRFSAALSAPIIAALAAEVTLTKPEPPLYSAPAPAAASLPPTGSRHK